MSETDCSSSSTTSQLERRKSTLPKKHKKSDKKSKKHKKDKERKSNIKKKLSHKDTLFSEKNFESELSTPNEETFGPALPPHLQNKNNNVEKPTDRLVIGPVAPKNFIKTTNLMDLETESGGVDEIKNSISLENDDNDGGDSYGPLPVANEREMTAVQIALERRALELKMAAIEGASTSVSEQNVREEWMLELPDVGLKRGLASLTNLKRSFHQGKEKPDFSDRSSWTKTPRTENEKNVTPSNISREKLEQQAQAIYEKQRDAEQEALAKHHKKKHKREKSLVEIHQKKLRKEEKKKRKELKDNKTKPERRPFTRDIDLKLNKIDRNQTKQIVDKAKILDTKFSAGHSKYL